MAIGRDLASDPPADAVDLTMQSEWSWLVGHYLFQGAKEPGLFLGPEKAVTRSNGCRRYRTVC